MVAATTRSAGHVQSLITSTTVPLPTHQLRNGRLNQMAYSLFLFIRDIADGDLVGWIDQQFQDADDPASPTGCPDCGRPWLDRSGRSMASPTRS